MATQFTDLVDMQQKSVAAFGPRPLFGTKEGSRWVWMTYAEFGRRVDHLRGGLAAQGIGRDDAVAIIAANRPEWAIAAYATYGLGARFVPMYEHQLEKDWQYIVNDSGAKLLLVSSRSIYDRVKDWPQTIPHLKGVFGMAQPKEEPGSFLALEQLGEERPTPTVAIDPQGIAGFIYTSGTTGNPKGVLLSHANFVSNVNDGNVVFPLTPDDRSLSFLPWAQSFGQTVELHRMMAMGCSVAMAESIEKLIDNFGEVRPTVLVSVPRIFNKIYDGLQKKMAEAGGMKKRLFDWALDNETQRRRLQEKNRTAMGVELKHKLYDKLVFAKVRERFGGQLRYAFSGGAALSPAVAEFIDKMGILVYEGYGLTETTPVVSANCRTARKIGSVGRPLPSVTVTIDTAAIEDGSGDGEVVVHGPNVMKGYHNLPEETAAVMTADGGFRTGDRGRLDSDGFLYITGRIKEQYKLENGKYVVPAPLEEQVQLSPFIVQAFIDGANKPFNVALIVPDRAAVEKWAKDKGLAAEWPAVLTRPELKQVIAEELDRQSGDWKGYERIKDFALIPEEFTTANGMLTPSLKVKRRVVVERYQDLLVRLWSQPE